jgi:hypothetical protein
MTTFLQRSKDLLTFSLSTIIRLNKIDPFSIMSVIEHTSVEIKFSQLNEKILNNNISAFRLTDVKVNGDDNDMFTFVRSLRGHPNIEEFSLNDVTCNESKVALDSLLSTVLVSLPKLKIFRLDNMQFAKGTIMSVGHCPTLTELSLRNNHLNDEDAGMIAQAMADSNSIQSIDLTGNSCLSDLANLAFAQALDKNMTLSSIKLDQLSVGGPHREELVKKLGQRVGCATQAA